jgi:hypothetical protein
MVMAVPIAIITTLSMTLSMIRNPIIIITIKALS